MKRIFLCLFVLCLAFPAMAEDKPSAPPIDVPELVFSQQVNIVVSIKKDPRVFDVKITQKAETIQLALIVDKNVEREQARMIATKAIFYAKGLSLDDPPKDDKKPGKGLYAYQVSVAMPDGVTVITAAKLKDKEEISFEDQFPDHPLTRADAAGR